MHLETYLHIYWLSLGVNSLWHLSEGFVLFMRLFFDKDIATMHEAKVAGALYIPNLTYLLTCVICLSLWSTLAIGLLYALFCVDPTMIKAAVTCGITAPMINYVVIKLIQKLK